MNMIQQQHRHVTRKRSNEQGGCPEKKEKAELSQQEEAKAARVDLEDGTHIKVTTQVTVQTQRQAETQADQPCCIQSVLRRFRSVRRGEPAGNLLKAVSGGDEKNIAIEFTGALPDNPATEFHIEKNDHANVLRYRSGDDNYYLAVKKSGEVNLRKLVNFPTNDKYFFRIRSVGPEIETFHTFKSLKSGEYLHCGNEGKAFMKEAKTIGDAEPEDRQTWFSYKPSASYKTQQHSLIQYKEEDMVFTENESCIECETVMETFEDTEDSGKGISNKLKKGTSEDSGIAENSEDPEVGDSINEPGKENDNDQRGMTEKLGEVNPEDLKEGNCQDSAIAENSEDPEEEENSNDPGRGITENPEDGTHKDLKEGNSEDSGMEENSEDREVGDCNEPGRGEGNSEELEKAENSEDLKEGNSEDPSKGNSEDAGKITSE